MSNYSDLPINYEEKCLCVLVLDVSGSMEGAPIDELNNGVRAFLSDINKNPTLRQRLEVGIITFNGKVKTIRPTALMDQFSIDFPPLVAGGTTATVDAVNTAIEMVTARKLWYKATGQTYGRSWVILMTDGDPDGNQNLSLLSSKLSQDVMQKKYEFLPIAVGDGTYISRLAALQVNLPVMRLQGLKFTSFFQWLSASFDKAIKDPKFTLDAAVNGPKDWGFQSV